MSHEVSTIIIGAGPIGLELAANFKKAGIHYRQFDAGQIGQTITWYPKQAHFFSSPDRIAICGIPLQTQDQSKATREEYLTYLRSVVQQHHLRINTYEKVTKLNVLGHQHFEVVTDKDTYYAENVITCIGDMHHPRKLNVPGEDLPHVSHYFDEPHQYFNQKLLIVGGKNSAVEAAIRCQRIGAKVSMSYRQARFNDKSIKYWLLPEIQWLTESKTIDFHPQSIVKRITPKTVEMESINGPIQVDADFVLLLTGYEMDTSLLKQAGVVLAGPNRAPVFDHQTMQTDVPGLYVAGTAAAGTQNKFNLFIENCHCHVVKIMRSLLNQEPQFVNPLAYIHMKESAPVIDSMPES
jgi:thioredoxin reductase (NADPH)